MHHTFSKRNAFGVGLSVGLGWFAAQILGALLMGGVMYGLQALFLR